MKRLFFSALLLFAYALSWAQVKEVKPYAVKPLSFSAQEEKEFNKKRDIARAIWKKQETESVNYELLSEEEREALAFMDEMGESYFDILGPGCSWYCGGGPYEITASSFLPPQSGNTYKPENAHDLDYGNAWVEGASGDGIGEYLVYHFEPYSPRITHIYVANGYVKTQTAWENNGRVKKLKMYVNDEPYAVLCLEDSRSEQAFEFPPIGNNRNEQGSIIDRENAKDWTLKFEILEVYKGNKYSDVAISEISFSGLDVHCFAKGTLVTMANDSTKPIEELEVGDKVKAYDFENYQPTTASIEKLATATHAHMVRYTFSNGKEIVVTPDHPFMVRAKGWASLKPEQTKQYKGYKTVNEIKVGDQFFSVNNSGTLAPITLSKIEEIHEEQETYTITRLSAGNNFLVGRFIVGAEELEE